jgi:putative acetyltransferase
MSDITIRQIRGADNTPLAALIREVFREFKIDRPGTVYTDPTTDTLYELFREKGSVYWVAEQEGKLLGGCGIYPTPGLPSGCVELVKLYLSAPARGKGLGNTLLRKSLDSAKEMGYRQVYLESLPELSKAVDMYERAGFVMLDRTLGDSGHYACHIWMLKEL